MDCGQSPTPAALLHPGRPPSIAALKPWPHPPSCIIATGVTDTDERAMARLGELAYRARFD